MKLRTICNPINISYCYQRDYCSREAADPAVIVYKDEYFLFASHNEGYWASKDLANWEYIKVDVEKHPEFTKFAPGLCVADDKVYLTHSLAGSILVSENPRDPDSWKDLGKPFDWYDPSFLYEDSFIYVYEGLTRDGGVSVGKLDPNDNMRLVDYKNEVCKYERKNRGCERRGDNNELDDATYFEGPWINKYNGKYYLQCAVPGTEYDTYADVCFISDNPMGPFEYCNNSPISFKSTGFVRGCGHGCLFEDLNGHFWKVQTNDISVNHTFERRISIYPAEFGQDGMLYTNTLRSDYPMLYPVDNSDPFGSPVLDWQLLSYKKFATASSILDDAHTPNYATDENMRTWWCAKTSNAGEWLSIDLEKEYEVYAVQVNFADQGISNDIGGRDGVEYGYEYILQTSIDGEKWDILADRRNNDKDIPHDYIQLDSSKFFRYIRITNCKKTPAGGFFAVSGIRVFGPSSGSAPQDAPCFELRRGEDERDAFIKITSTDDSQGYYVRFGISEDAMYTHYCITPDMLDENGEYRMGCLNVGVSYFATVDAYNEGGITKGTVIKTF